MAQTPIFDELARAFEEAGKVRPETNEQPETSPTASAHNGYDGETALHASEQAGSSNPDTSAVPERPAGGRRRRAEPVAEYSI